MDSAQSRDEHICSHKGKLVVYYGGVRVSCAARACWTRYFQGGQSHAGGGMGLTRGCGNLLASFEQIPSGVPAQFVVITGKHCGASGGVCRWCVGKLGN